MNTSTWRKRFGALLATSITLAGVVVGTGSPTSAYGVVQTDEFRFRTNGFDFGDDDFSNGQPQGKATIDWETFWYGNQATVSGTIHLKNVSGECARIKVVTYDAAGVAQSPANFSEEKCATTNNHFSRTVEVRSDVGASEIKVVLQKRQDIDGSPWSKVRKKRFDFGPVLKTDDVRIKREQFKFGDGDWDGNGPSDFGTLTWHADGYEPYVNLRGKLFIKNADERCGRMRLKLISTTYGVRDNVYGAEECVDDDDEYTFDINLGSYLDADSFVDKVKVIVQRRPNGGAWENAGAKTYTLP